MRGRHAFTVAFVLFVLWISASSALGDLIAVTGQITGMSENGRAIVLDTDDGSLPLRTDGATLVKAMGKEVTPADLKIGNTVRVKYATVHGRNLAAEISMEREK